MTVLLSFWRNDAERQLDARMAHLLAKRGVDRWLWVVGDSTDATEAHLREAAAEGGLDVTVLRHDTGIAGEAPAERLLRLSETADAALDAIAPTDDRVVIHESDLESAPDIVTQLHGTEQEAVAGWPTLTLGAALGSAVLFYDTFCYRALGQRFNNRPPYHPVYRPDVRFEVDSVGSCWSFPAWAVRAGARCDGLAAIGLSTALRARGVRIWVDPTVRVVQPAELWTLQMAPPV